MSIQITVRLDEELVAGVDALVKSGRAKSRAQVVESALERELRRSLYAEEATVLRRSASDADLDALADWMVGEYPQVD